MPRYLHTILVVIEADDYEASQKIAEDIAEGLGCEGEDASVPFYAHDNENQRLVYLNGYEPLPEDEVE